MMGRSGSSAGSWVAASQSLRIGRWRCGALLDDCMRFLPGAEGFRKSATAAKRGASYDCGRPVEPGYEPDLIISRIARVVSESGKCTSEVARAVEPVVSI